MSKNPLKDKFKLEVTDEDRKNLSPEDIKALEELFRKIKNDEIDYIQLNEYNEDRFSAKGMEKVGSDGPPDWSARDEKKKGIAEETKDRDSKEKPKKS